MAWLESWQSLREHPKTKRAARTLGVPRVHLIGHLHCLWWWAMDFAPDGDLSKYEPEDIAEGAEWDGDPEAFIKALVGCGGRGGPGFLELDGEDLHIHDWRLHGGRLADARLNGSKGGVKGNHIRWHVERDITDPNCPECIQGSGGESGGDSDRVATGQDRTEDGKTSSSPDGDKPTPDDGFEHFWAVWPKRNGKKLAKDKAHRAWSRLTLPERRDAYRGAMHYAAASNAGLAGAKDAFRWLQGREWPDWQTPAQAGQHPDRTGEILEDGTKRGVM